MSLGGRRSAFLYFPLCCLSPLLLLGVVYSGTIHGGACACLLGLDDDDAEEDVSLYSAWVWGLKIYMLVCGRGWSSLGFVFHY